MKYLFISDMLEMGLLFFFFRLGGCLRGRVIVYKVFVCRGVEGLGNSGNRFFVICFLLR